MEFGYSYIKKIINELSDPIIKEDDDLLKISTDIEIDFNCISVFEDIIEKIFLEFKEGLHMWFVPPDDDEYTEPEILNFENYKEKNIRKFCESEINFKFKLHINKKKYLEIKNISTYKTLLFYGSLSNVVKDI